MILGTDMMKNQPLHLAYHFYMGGKKKSFQDSITLSLGLHFFVCGPHFQDFVHILFPLRPKLRKHIWVPSFQKSFLKYQLVICFHLKEFKREKLKKTCKSTLVTCYSKYYLCLFTSLRNIWYGMHMYTKITQNPLVAVSPHKEGKEELKQSSTILFSSWTF